jgi:hypothetical protein
MVLQSVVLQSLDHASISYYISNFPNNLKANDHRKIFARYGSAGGKVYIPKKVDKWDKHFSFVKFKGVKEVEELNKSLGNVWSSIY